MTLQPGASIRGRVLDEAGHSVTSCSIRAHPARGTRDDWSKTGDVSISCTGAGGEFEIVGLHDGEWSVTAEAPRYAKSAASRVAVPGDGSPVDIVLRRTATLSGLVVDESGRPVPYARVYLGVPVEGVPNRFTFRVSTSTDQRTDSNGLFTLTDVIPSSVMLSAGATGWADSEIIPIEIQSGQSISGLRLTLGCPMERTRNK
jgi:uncharacterized GH25 family protein